MSNEIAVQNAVDPLSPVVAGSAKKQQQFVQVPYVGFRGVKSTKRLEELDAAGVKPNDFYLQDVQPIAIKPFEVHLLQYSRAYTQVDDEGNVIDAVFEQTRETYQEGFEEHLLATVAVFQRTDDGQVFTAATLQLRKAHCKALESAIQLLEGRASDPKQWSSASGNHKASAKAVTAGGRFRVGIWSTQEKPKSGKGNPYNMGWGKIIMPTQTEKIDDTEAFNRWFEEAKLSVLLAIGANVNKQKKFQALYDKRRGIETPTDASDPIPF